MSWPIHRDMMNSCSLSTPSQHSDWPTGPTTKQGILTKSMSEGAYLMSGSHPSPTAHGYVTQDN